MSFFEINKSFFYVNSVNCFLRDNGFTCRYNFTCLGKVKNGVNNFYSFYFNVRKWY